MGLLNYKIGYLIQVLVYPVGKWALVPFPHPFGRVELWAVGREEKEYDVLRYLKAVGLVEGTVVEDYYFKFVRSLGRKLIDEGLEAAAVAAGELQQQRISVDRGEGPEQIG